jgi:hypothetical protein
MVSWIQQRYVCGGRCRQIDVATMLPLLWVSIAVYALAVVVRIMTVVATSTHEFAHVWCMTHIVRLAFCDRPPYAVFDGEYRGAWLSVVTGIIQARNMTVEYVQEP